MRNVCGPNQLASAAEGGPTCPPPARTPAPAVEAANSKAIAADEVQIELTPKTTPLRRLHAALPGLVPGMIQDHPLLSTTIAAGSAATAVGLGLKLPEALRPAAQTALRAGAVGAGVALAGAGAMMIHDAVINHTRMADVEAAAAAAGASALDQNRAKSIMVREGIARNITGGAAIGVGMAAAGLALRSPALLAAAPAMVAGAAIGGTGAQFVTHAAKRMQGNGVTVANTLGLAAGAAAVPLGAHFGASAALLVREAQGAGRSAMAPLVRVEKGSANVARAVAGAGLVAIGAVLGRDALRSAQEGKVQTAIAKATAGGALGATGAGLFGASTGIGLTTFDRTARAIGVALGAGLTASALANSRNVAEAVREGNVKDAISYAGYTAAGTIGGTALALASVGATRPLERAVAAVGRNPLLAAGVGALAAGAVGYAAYRNAD